MKKKVFAFGLLSLTTALVLGACGSRGGASDGSSDGCAYSDE